MGAVGVAVAKQFFLPLYMESVKTWTVVQTRLKLETNQLSQHSQLNNLTLQRHIKYKILETMRIVARKF